MLYFLSLSIYQNFGGSILKSLSNNFFDAVRKKICSIACKGSYCIYPNKPNTQNCSRKKNCTLQCTKTPHTKCSKNTTTTTNNCSSTKPNCVRTWGPASRAFRNSDFGSKLKIKVVQGGPRWSTTII